MNAEGTAMKGSAKKPIPLNWRTVVFCFLMGSVLSVPIGGIPSRFILWEPPEYLYDYYEWTVVGSFLLLPFWSIAVRPYPPLMTIGVVTFVGALLLGSLFPAL